MQILDVLQARYPDAVCALNFTSPFELIVATILSAQCTDERVNLVTPALFKRFPNPHKMALAPLGELEELILSTGFYKNKSKSLKGMSEALVSKHGGAVPKNMEDLVELPGVGRKTANVVLGNAFHIASGVVVDTHVTRLTNRLSLAHGENAVALEKTLNEIVPQKYWIDFSHWLISHGRKICKARSPSCESCFLLEFCPTGKSLIGSGKN